MYQGLAKPFKHEVINWMCTYNEFTLFIISMMQTIFITDIRDVSVVTNTGWAMIAMTVTMIFINFAVVIVYTIKNKLKKIKLSKQVTTNEIHTNTVSCDNSTIRITRYNNMSRN